MPSPASTHTRPARQFELLSQARYQPFFWTVFLGTFYPLFVELIGPEKISVGPPYFNRSFGPIMVALCLAFVWWFMKEIVSDSTFLNVLLLPSSAEAADTTRSL